MTTKTVTINVTQAHIDAGVIGDCRWCPVALAMTEAGISEATAGIYISGYLHGLLVGGDTPQSVICFIHKFDSDKPVKPFSFEVELSPYSEMLLL